MNNTIIPDGWIYTTLGNVCLDTQYGWTTSAAKEGNIHLLRTSDITSGNIDWDTVPFCEKEPTDINKYILNDGDIVISRAGSIGFSHLIQNPKKSVFASYLIRFKPLINKKYIAFFLKSIFYWNFISENSIGIAVPNVNATKLKQIPIPVPPLSEQQRIVFKIEELFTNLDAGLDSLNKAKLQLEQYRQSVLKAAFEGKLTERWREEHMEELESAIEMLERIKQQRRLRIRLECQNSNSGDLPESWAYCKLGDWIYIAGRIGWRGLKAEEYKNEGPLLLSVYNLNKGLIVDLSSSQHITSERYEESPEIQLKNDDVLLVKDGAGIGKIGIVQNLNIKATVNSSLLVIRTMGVFVPKYILYYLQGPRMREIVKSRITGSATPHLFQKDIKKFNLLVPPLLEQQKIVEEIENYFSIFNEIEKNINLNIGLAELLRQGILLKAFEGKLVSQDPNDEPAEILLERIKAEKAKIQKEKKTRKKNNQKVLDV